MFLRGFYGNGFDVKDYEGKEVIVVVGGIGFLLVRGVVDYFVNNIDKCEIFNLICGFKLFNDVLFKVDLKEWEKNINLILIVDKVEEGYDGKIGLVIIFILDLEIKDVKNIVFVVVGFFIMMKFIVVEILKRGVLEENIWIF